MGISELLNIFCSLKQSIYHDHGCPYLPAESCVEQVCNGTKMSIMQVCFTMICLFHSGKLGADGMPRFRFQLLNQTGTMWYHAHISWLRASVHGPIVLRPRKFESFPFTSPKREITIMIGKGYLLFAIKKIFCH